MVRPVIIIINNEREKVFVSKMNKRGVRKEMIVYGILLRL